MITIVFGGKNKVMNLTTIIEKEDVVLKHFIDSIYIMKYTDFDEKKLLILEQGQDFQEFLLLL